MVLGELLARLNARRLQKMGARALVPMAVAQTHNPDASNRFAAVVAGSIGRAC